ncbi:MAG: protein BatD [Gammaproteobacteria bacterium]|nr:protein BatD [Gammaproteobacteria bacterium]
MTQQHNKTPILIAYYLLIFLLLSPCHTLLAQVTASTDRASLSIDETINLHIKSDQESGDPDFSVLENQFQILSKSKSQNYSVINGVTSRTHTWNITLLPKKIGTLIIPAISVGNEQSQPIHLTVNKPSKSPGIDGKDVYLKVNIEDKKDHYYVQQQVMVTVQLFHRIRFSNASLNDLTIDNAVVEKIGEDSQYNKTVGQHRYNIIERRYAVFPQKSGTLHIPALIFSGNVEISQSFSLFSQAGRKLIRQSQSLQLTIQAIPDSYTGSTWLPAENLTIEAKIIDNTQAIMMGEAITRHIIVTATGLLGSQLPAIEIPASKAIKIYPDKEQINSQLINNKIVGSRRDIIAIIPLKEGEFTLPEITLDWWNTQTQQQETAVLKAQTLLAQANPEQVIQPTRVTSSTQDVIETTTEQVLSETKIIYKELPLIQNKWFWSTLVLSLLGLFTLIIGLIRSRKSHTSTKIISHSEQLSINAVEADHYLQQVYNHCNNNEAHQTSQALVQWANYYFNTALIPDLSEVIALSNDTALSEAIMNLEQCQYSQDKEHWQGHVLETSLKAYLQKNRENNTKKKVDPQAFASLNL